MQPSENIKKTKLAAVKALAVIGFLVTIVFLVWASVQAIRFIPDAITSLASLAESIQEYDPYTVFTLTPEKNIVNSGETVSLTWDNTEGEGDIRISFVCVEGVSVILKSPSTGRIAMQCNDKLTLPSTLENLSLTITSERQRFIDVLFKAAFEPSSGGEPKNTETSVTVVNASIPQSNGILSGLENTQSTASVGDATEQEEEPEDSNQTTSQTDSTEPVTSVTPATPTTYETTYTYFPESQPNGYTDLAIQYVGVGTINGGSFVPRAILRDNDRSAVKFEVQNIGTKTSGDWTFNTLLPSGVVFESDRQAPLRPNEKVAFTLGFTVNDAAQSSRVSATVFGGNDYNTANNSFTWSVRVTN